MLLIESKRRSNKMIILGAQPKNVQLLPERVSFTLKQADMSIPPLSESKTILRDKKEYN